MYIQTQEPDDYAQCTHKIQFLDSSFTVHENNFAELPRHSFVILDDFSFALHPKDKLTKVNFLRVINYVLRHSQITLVLVIHNLYSNNLFTDILLAPHLFLSYSNLGYMILR